MMTDSLADYKAYCMSPEGRAKALMLVQEFDCLNQVYHKIRSKLVDKSLVTADDLSLFLYHVNNFIFGGSNDDTV